MSIAPSDSEFAARDDRRLCPACDYDLHGNTTGRCPECGTVVGHGYVSRVPWVHRAYRGGRRAYLETLWLLLLRPGKLAAETTHRVHIAHARRFHVESVWLGTIFTVATFTVGYLLRGPALENFFSPDGVAFMQGPAVWFPESPALVLSDSIFMIVPLVVSVFLSLKVTMWMYRLVFAVGRGSRPEEVRARYRASVLAYYGSGIMPLVMLFVGGLIATIILRTELNVVPNWLWTAGMLAGLILFPILTFWAFYYPTLTLLRRAGRAGPLRVFFMAYLFPLLQPPIWIAIGTVIYWISGFLVIAAWSTFH
jgi:hypothetical protein